MYSNSDAAFWRFSHAPNRDPNADRSGKHRRVADGIIRPSPTVFCGLHGLADDAADGIGGVTLHPLRGVGVGAESEARVVVSQCTGQRLDIHAVLEGQRGEGVSEVVEAYVLRTVLLRPGTGRSCPPAVSSSLAFPTSAGGSLWRDWRGAAACGCPAPRGC